MSDVQVECLERFHGIHPYLPETGSYSPRIVTDNTYRQWVQTQSLLNDAAFLLVPLAVMLFVNFCFD